MKLHHKETCSLNLSVVLQTFPSEIRVYIWLISFMLCYKCKLTYVKCWKRVTWVSSVYFNRKSWSFPKTLTKLFWCLNLTKKQLCDNVTTVQMSYYVIKCDMFVSKLHFESLKSLLSPSSSKLTLQEKVQLEDWGFKLLYLMSSEFSLHLDYTEWTFKDKITLYWSM